MLKKKEQVLGTVSYKRLSNNVLKLRQMVIDTDYQLKGLGKLLIQQSEKDIINKYDYKTIELAARLHAKNFYMKLGYIPIGNIFKEVNIDHIKMYKMLK